MPPFASAAWLVYVNEQGRRFVTETAPYAVMAAVLQHQGGRVYAIFDEASHANATPPDAAFSTDVAATSWTAETLAELIDAGRILRAETLDELAAQT